jgi:hypothetical protein
MLITGRYGAGKVAVMASSLTATTGWGAASDWWKSLLTWLTPEDVTAEIDAPIAGKPEMSISSSDRILRVRISNPGPTALRGKLVVRLMTWEGALIGDLNGGSSEVSIGPQKIKEIDFPVPPPSPTNYQALDVADAYHVSAGLLSPGGTQMLVEHRGFLDFRKLVSLAIYTDNIDSPSMFPGTPSSNDPSPFSKVTRMGARISSYAYAPGATVNAEVVVSNGLVNLAPFAQVRDETTPENLAVSSLNDGAIVARKGPIDGIDAYSMWTGAEGKENILRFSFPMKVSVASVALVGTPSGAKGEPAQTNPAAIVVEIDGKEVARNMSTDALFKDGYGRASLDVKLVEGSQVVIRLPVVSGSNGKRRASWLGEIEIMGWLGSPGAAVSGVLKVKREDGLHAESAPLLEKPISLAYGERLRLPVQFTMPSGAAGPEFYRLIADYDSVSVSAPLLLVSPGNGLKSLTETFPDAAPHMGYIVTRGFRNVFTTGTGTQEINGGWGQPDDLVWAYSRQLTQLGVASRTLANRLYVTESDLRHYCTPWRSFSNDEFFYDLAPALIVENMKKMSQWPKSDMAILNHSDRWDTGPDVGALHGWQDFVEFDEYLRASNKAGLAGKTRQEITRDLHDNHEAEWQAWQLARYIRAVGNLRKTFADAGKRLVISAQGQPMVASDEAAILAETVLGMSDDSTWGMFNADIPITTGRQLGAMAFNPVWQISTLLAWGFNNSVLDNAHWHSPVGTTEPSRRHYVDRAWRAMVGHDGRYGSVYTYGFNSNVGIA